MEARAGLRLLRGRHRLAENAGAQDMWRGAAVGLFRRMTMRAGAPLVVNT
jgi:hypothetical protein